MLFKSQLYLIKLNGYICGKGEAEKRRVGKIIKLIKTNEDDMNCRVWQTQLYNWGAEKEQKALEQEYSGKGTSYSKALRREVLAFWGAKQKTCVAFGRTKVRREGESG